MGETAEPSRLKLESVALSFGGVRAIGLRRDHHAAGVLVEAMDDARAEHATDAREIGAVMEQRVDERPARVSRRGMHDHFGELGDDDEIAVIRYSERSELVAPLARVGNVRSSLSAKIRELDAAGGTNIPGGLSHGLRALDEAAVRRVTVPDAASPPRGRSAPATRPVQTRAARRPRRVGRKDPPRKPPRPTKRAARRGLGPPVTPTDRNSAERPP